MILLVLLASVSAHQAPQIPAAFTGNWIDMRKGCNSGTIGAHLYVSRSKLSDGEFEQALDRVQVLSPGRLLVWATVDTAERPQPRLTYDLRLRTDGKLERREAEGHRSLAAHFTRELDTRCGAAQ